jgi:hypothetical protein
MHRRSAEFNGSSGPVKYPLLPQHPAWDAVSYGQRQTQGTTA